MSVKQATTDPTEMFRIWLCNGCYGRGFAAGFFHGITDLNYMDIAKTTEVTTTIGGHQITLIKREYTKHVTYNDEWFSPHGIVYDGLIDTAYASYWDNIAKDCWGKPKPKEWLGEYESSLKYTNTQIYFADLREDILVYYTESGSQSASGSHDQPLGMQLGYAIWNGAEKPACRGVNIQDAIKIPLQLSPSSKANELITKGGYTVYNKQNNSTRQFNVAASEPFSTVFNMDIIDQSKPYDCKEGVFTNLIEPESLWAYRNSWDGFGSYTDIDNYDESIWYGNFIGQGVNHIKNGTYDYPNFINIDSMPRGSWATDYAGNHFFSMITRDMKTFNKLNGQDPNTVAKLEGAGVVYYPVAPA